MSSSGHPRLAVVLATVAAVLLVLAVNIRHIRSRYAPFEREGPAFVHSFARELATGDPKRVVPYLAPELSRKFQSVQLANFLKKYTKYGNVESVSRTGTMRIAAVDASPYPEVVYFRTTVNYEKSPATVEVLLVRTRRDGLKVWSFSVDSGTGKKIGHVESALEAASEPTKPTAEQ